jgi:hypothetical protein
MSYESTASVFWRYLTEPVALSVVDQFGQARVPTMDDDEYRVLSKATNAAGGFAVPTDFD